MPLVTTKDLLIPARREKRAVCAFNVTNYETAAAVLDAAETRATPVIIQIYQRLFNDRKAEHMAGLIRRMAETSAVDVALHLDHGLTVEQTTRAVDYGFTSVMFDGSPLPWAENIEQTRAAVAYAHAHGVSVEGEIGHVPTVAASERPLTTPAEGEEFARETGVDSLAVAVGTAHGFYPTAPVIDLGLAEAIGKKVALPLVLHGGSGTPPETVRALIGVGFAKINIATEFMDSFLKALRIRCETTPEFKPVDLFLAPVVTETAAYVCGLMKSFS
jgi:ketose-bisphosphate aldolase